MVNNRKYNLIYLDLKMPGMNGVDTLREIHKIDPDASVYVVTAFHHEFLKELESVQYEGINFELAKKPLLRNQIIQITAGILDGPEKID